MPQMVLEAPSPPGAAESCVVGPRTYDLVYAPCLFAAITVPDIRDTAQLMGLRVVRSSPSFPEVLSTGGRVSDKPRARVAHRAIFCYLPNTCVTLPSRQFRLVRLLRQPAGWCGRPTFFSSA